jgi:hypothetical protein
MDTLRIGLVYGTTSVVQDIGNVLHLLGLEL